MEQGAEPVPAFVFALVAPSVGALVLASYFAGSSWSAESPAGMTSRSAASAASAVAVVVAAVAAGAAAVGAAAAGSAVAPGSATGSRSSAGVESLVSTCLGPLCCKDGNDSFGESVAAAAVAAAAAVVVAAAAAVERGPPSWSAPRLESAA